MVESDSGIDLMVRRKLSRSFPSIVVLPTGTISEAVNGLQVFKRTWVTQRDDSVILVEAFDMSSIIVLLD